MTSESMQQNFRDFFIQQRDKLEKIARHRVGAMIGVGLTLIGLLTLLRSPWFVWAWVALLYGAMYVGAQVLGTAGRRAKAAIKDLADLTVFLGKPVSAEDLKTYLKSKIKPDDSNVPEALYAVCAGQATGDGLRTAANSSFSQPAAALSVAHFVRTALVLAGLFGTVLFFSFELGKPQLLSGDLATLLPGVRGALASTLAGIMGSVVLGYLGSRIEQVIEESIWETESLLNGPFAQALSQLPANLEAVNEVELWRTLIREVALLRNDTSKSVAQLSNDISAHAVALAALEQRLAGMPAIRIPPELARLSDVAQGFSDGMRMLEPTVKRLVEAAATVNVTAPLEIVKELRSASANLDILIKKSDATADRLHVAIGQRSTTAELAAAKSSLTDAVTAIGASVSKGNSVILTRIEAGTLATTDAAKGLRAQIEDLRNVVLNSDKPDGLPTADPRVQGPGATIPEPPPLAETARQLSQSLDSVRRLETELNDQREKLIETVNDVDGLRTSVQAIRRHLESIRNWHVRAARAPLMNMLLMPWRRPKASQNGA